MARKDLFARMRAPEAPGPGAPEDVPAAPPADAPRTSAPPSPAVQRAVESRLPIKAMTNDLLSNSQREIDPDLIEDDSPRDRLIVEDQSLLELRELIRAQGQIVPILVRRVPERPDNYRIVYGRRRLAAVRGIPGMKIKALLRNLTDEQAVITQGQENNARRDPSFIEKALFAASLKASGYEASVILDALVTDRHMLSKMKSVTDVVPLDLIQVIGAAHGIGRPRWLEFTEALKAANPADAVATCFPDGPPEGATSEDRFSTALAALKAVVSGQHSRHAPKSRDVRGKDGTVLASFKGPASALDIRLSRKQPEFAAWVSEKGEEIFGRLYEEWAKERGAD